MANIKVAESAGFCFGVKIAVDSAVEAGKKFGKAFTNGPIIHNKQVVQFLEGLNVKELKSYDQLKEGTRYL